MAHTLCINEHNMWNGDGQVIIWAFPAKLVRDFSEQHPDLTTTLDKGEPFMLYDMYSYDSVTDKELDIWRCLDCRSLAIFIRNGYRDEMRYDYILADPSKAPSPEVYQKWQKYYAFSDKGFDDFCETTNDRGLTPYLAIEDFFNRSGELYYAFLSDDKQSIVVTHANGKIFALYQLKSTIEFDGK